MIRARVDVWRIRLARPAAEVTALHGLLDQAERRRANMFRAKRDRNRFVVAHATLRMVLAKHAGVEPHRVKIIVPPGGKPIVAGDAVSGPLHFNLSHCGQLALCAIADREVGVDLEQLEYHDDMERVALHFFSDDEARILASLSGMDRTRFFFRTWVRKEAYVKASGEGLARDTTRFSVQEPAAGVTLHASDGSSRVDNSCTIYDLPDIDDHFAAVALAAVGATPAIHCREWPT